MFLFRRILTAIPLKAYLGCYVTLFCLILQSILFNNPTMAQGNLLITPRRVVFEGSKKAQELNLANTGGDTATYNISLIQYRMNEDGSFEQITEPDSGQYFADKNIRFFPRQVKLPPLESQVVKMQLKRTSDMAPGEHRSHIYFRASPVPTALGSEDIVIDTNNLSIKLTPVFGITIPVIIRTGESTAEVTISDLTMETVNDTIPQLSTVLNRSGTISVYGDLVINYIDIDQSVTMVGFVKGIAVYTPNKRRIFKLGLLAIPGILQKKGKLEVIYQTQSSINPAVMARKELILN